MSLYNGRAEGAADRQLCVCEIRPGGCPFSYLRVLGPYHRLNKNHRIHASTDFPSILRWRSSHNNFSPSLGISAWPENEKKGNKKKYQHVCVERNSERKSEGAHPNISVCSSLNKGRRYVRSSYRCPACHGNHAISKNNVLIFYKLDAAEDATKTQRLVDAAPAFLSRK